MKYSILVIDDQMDMREKYYKHLETEINASQSGIEVCFKFVGKPEDLNIPKPGEYAGAIVDAVLTDGWGPDFGITWVLRQLGPDIPVAVISSRWDSTNTVQMNEAWAQPNCQTFLHWRDMKQGRSKGDIRYPIVQITGMIARNKHLSLDLKLEPNDPIHIVHLSDLHMGGFDDRRLSLETDMVVDHILRATKSQPPEFVCISGDIAQLGLPDEYDAAEKWLTDLVQALKMPAPPNPRILLSPGNHDVCIPLGSAGYVEFKKDEKSKKIIKKIKNKEIAGTLRYYGLSPFRNFLKRMTCCTLLDDDDRDTDLAWVEDRFRHLGIFFYGLNTALPIRGFNTPGRELSADALSNIRRKISSFQNEENYKSSFIIGMGHHCPTSAASDRGVSNFDEFNLFYSGGEVSTDLFLHGHAHEQQLIFQQDGEARLLRSAAATLTKPANTRPHDTLRGLTLLRLERSNHEVIEVQGTSYDWKSNKLVPNTPQAWTRPKGGYLSPK